MDLKKLTPEQYISLKNVELKDHSRANTSIIMRMETIIVFVVTKYCSNLKLNMTLGQAGLVFMMLRIRKILPS